MFLKKKKNLKITKNFIYINLFLCQIKILLQNMQKFFKITGFFQKFSNSRIFQVFFAQIVKLQVFACFSRFPEKWHPVLFWILNTYKSLKHFWASFNKNVLFKVKYLIILDLFEIKRKIKEIIHKLKTNSLC